jgi:hypothetical protein
MAKVGCQGNVITHDRAYVHGEKFIIGRNETVKSTYANTDNRAGARLKRKAKVRRTPS